MLSSILSVTLSFASPCEHTYPVTTLRIVDGDTVEATLQLPMRTLRRETFRLARIDAPEMYTAEGKLAKIALTEKLKGQSVEIGTQGTEKYGRWLGEVCINGESVNDWMLKVGHAKEY